MLLVNSTVYNLLAEAESKQKLLAHAKIIAQYTHKTIYDFEQRDIVKINFNLHN